MADRSFDFALERMPTPSSSDVSSLKVPEPALIHPATEHDVEKTQSHTSHVSKKNDSQAMRITTAQDWTGPDDLGNPLNWSIPKKIFHVVIPAAQCFTV